MPFVLCCIARYYDIKRWEYEDLMKKQKKLAKKPKSDVQRDEEIRACVDWLWLVSLARFETFYVCMAVVFSGRNWRRSVSQCAARTTN